MMFFNYFRVVSVFRGEKGIERHRRYLTMVLTVVYGV